MIDTQNIQPTPTEKQVWNRNVLKCVRVSVPGTTAQTANNYGTFLLADRKLVITSIVENHNVATGGNGTLNIEKCSSGVAQGSGVLLLNAAFSLSASALIPKFGVLTTSKQNLTMIKGDRLNLKVAGTITTLEDVCVTIYFYEL